MEDKTVLGGCAGVVDWEEAVKSIRGDDDQAGVIPGAAAL